MSDAEAEAEAEVEAPPTVTVEITVSDGKNLKALVSSFNLTAGGDAANAIDESIIDNIETGLKDRDLRFYGPVRACVCRVP